MVITEKAVSNHINALFAKLGIDQAHREIERVRGMAEALPYRRRPLTGAYQE
jgi:hypothetical protein